MGVRGTLACAVLACVGTAAAQQDAPDAADDAIPLPPIDVIGLIPTGWQGAPDTVYQTPAPVAVIGREAIDARGGARNAGDLVRGAPGLNAVQDRQSPGFNVNIRGLQDQGRVNMSIDGARQNFQQSGHGSTAFAFVDPELVGGVEIEKGPSSLAGGAGVIGGVVNFRTLDFSDIATGDKDWGARVNATTGSNAFDFNGSAAVATRVGDSFEAVAAVGRKKLGEYRTGKRGELEQDTDPANPLVGEAARFTTQDQWSWLAKARAEFADDHRLTLSYTGLTTDFGTGSGPYIDESKVTNNTAVADYRWTPEFWWADVAAKLYYTRTSDDQFRPARLRDSEGDPADPANVRYPAARVDYAIDTYGGSIANTTRFAVPLFDVALTYGGEYFLDKTDTASVLANPAADPDNNQFSGSNPIGERGVGGAFANAELSHAEWLKIIAGLRYDRFDLTGDGEVYDGQTTGCGRNRCPTPFSVDRSAGRASPTATVAVTPLAGVQFYGSYKEGFRPPNIMEAIFGGSHIGGALAAEFAPNPNLRPEVSKSWEAGLNLKFDGIAIEDDAFRAKLSVYTNDVDNFITQGVVYAATGRAFFANVNLDKPAKFRGIDLEANYDAGFAYLGGSANFLDAKYNLDYDAGPGGREGSILTVFLAPKRKIVVDGGLRFLDRALTFGGRLTSVTPEDFEGAFAPGYIYKKYTLLDLYASYKLNEHVTFRAAVENLRDLAYIEALGTQISPSPGRTFTIGATARF